MGNVGSGQWGWKTSLTQYLGPLWVPQPMWKQPSIPF